jgi:hypothetical protein
MSAMKVLSQDRFKLGPKLSQFLEAEPSSDQPGSLPAQTSKEIKRPAHGVNEDQDGLHRQESDSAERPTSPETTPATPTSQRLGSPLIFKN